MRESIAGIILKDYTFLIGLRLPKGEMGGRWEFPGGKIDPGETAEIAIRREFLEEMNIDVSIGELITTVEFTNHAGPSLLHAYHVSIPDHASIVLTEHSELRWATLQEIEELPFVDSDRLLLPEIKKWHSRIKHETL
ncbi:(deoxy)nucleoside triphosphate pyrophosphohydrolase [Treponema zuelzerae]|uniref:8-oxo-dGTP diphosphatase n=1 Tax=Teretinema zuelzerae TaxID=156 RepID=A0AAE3EH19_9SPIR|nr:(deoxy)nucleoside triphosphate pyrophosphohydrolase [Teretinema zuelzerae]MCD1654549.1 (deoxy)nucleoside triphosphate pyrophosphohydrolase [Teretinema zuelzerae]